jgi:hypothetical protein
MDYGRLITRSLHLTWRYKWLWLLAFFAAESSGSASYNGQGLTNEFPGTGVSGTRGQPNFPPFLSWIQGHLAFLLVAAVVLLVIFVVFFFISCGAEAAVVRGAEAADQDEDITLGRAISLGMERLWPVVRLRLLLLLAAVEVALMVAVLVGLIVVGFVVHAYLAVALLIVALIGFGVLLFLVAVVFPTFTRLWLRAAILDRTGAVDGMTAAIALIRRRPGQVVVLWAIELAVSLGIGLALVIVLLVIAAPAAVMGFGASATGGGATLVALAALGVVLGIALLVFGAALSAYLSVYWTLGYRQLQRA